MPNAPSQPKPKTSSTANGSQPRRRTRGFEVIAWIEAHCVHPRGPLIGQPARLSSWERALVLRLFEIRDDGRRRYRWAYISVPKKQGKTTLIAWIACYLLIGDETEAAPEIICAAASDEQADLLFGSVGAVCKMSPTLRQVTEVFEREILVPSRPGASLKRVAAVAGTNDGQNNSIVLLDELHEWAGPKGEATWNVLTNSTAARPEPLVIQITTAGWDAETICGRQYEYAKAVEAGEIDDPRYFVHIVEAPDDADWRDPTVWEAYNPSYGVTTDGEFYADQVTKKTESVFRRYFLNQWMPAEELWLPPGSWDACRSDLELDRRLPIAVGVDLALTHDTTAVVIVQRQGDRLVCRARFWTNPYLPGNPRHDEWELDVARVMDHLRELRATYPARAVDVGRRGIAGPAYCYDPWGFREEAKTLLDEGLAMVEVPQTDARMAPAARELYDAIVERRLAHDGNRTLAAHLRNVLAVPRGENGWRLRKVSKGSPRKIDGAIALAMAVHQAVQPQPKRQVGAFTA